MEPHDPVGRPGCLPDRVDKPLEGDLKKTDVAELLTNRIYIGELRGGGRREPVISRDIWESVRANRARHARRVPGPTRYRNVDGCATFPDGFRGARPTFSIEGVDVLAMELLVA